MAPHVADTATILTIPINVLDMVCLPAFESPYGD
jgi:hypothetical protein